MRNWAGNVFADYGEALQKFRPDMVLICTPPVYHVEEALAALQARAHVFIEKPLSHESSGIQALIAEARRRDRNVSDRLQHAVSSRLADIERADRFGKDRARAVAQRGSGAIPSRLATVAALSRELQRAPGTGRGYHSRRFSRIGLHLLAAGASDGSDLPGGAPQQSGRGCGRFGVDLPDFSGAAARGTASGFCAAGIHAHVQGCGRDRDCALGFQRRRKCAGFHAEQPGWNSIPYVFEANDMYVAEMVHFLESLGSGTGPMVDLEQSRDVIRVVEAAKRSSEEGRPQTLNWTSEASEGPVVAIIQARMGSSRLPGKSLAEIEKRPMLWHVIQRVKRATPGGSRGGGHFDRSGGRCHREHVPGERRPLLSGQRERRAGSFLPRGARGESRRRWCASRPIAR